MDMNGSWFMNQSILGACALLLMNICYIPVLAKLSLRQFARGSLL